MCNYTQVKQGINHYDINTQAKIVISCAILHSYLQEYQRNNEIFIVYMHENIAVDDIDQQMVQSNKIGSSSRPNYRAMQV